MAKRNDVRAASPVFDRRRRFREEDGEAASGGFVPAIVAPGGDTPPADGGPGAAARSADYPPVAMAR